jgi:type II protein arginine methyltransferase
MDDEAKPGSLIDTPWALTRTGAMLMRNGQGDKAVALARSALARRPGDPELASALRMMLSQDIALWHSAMLADAPRNRAFEEAISRAAAGAQTVLDIGTGSGLLSMIAARAGAKRVVACEINAALAATAREVIAANGHEAVIEVIAKPSVDLDREKDLGGGADLIVAEVFGDDLVNEGALRTLHHAMRELARPGARIVPAAGAIRVAPAWHARPLPPTGEAAGFDLGPFERHLRPYQKVQTDDPSVELRGEPADLFEFDFQGGGPFDPDRARVVLTAAGPANGVVQWIRLNLDARTEHENRPGAGRRSSWAAAFRPLPDGRIAQAGDALVVNGAHDGGRVHLWMDR